MKAESMFRIRFRIAIPLSYQPMTAYQSMKQNVPQCNNFISQHFYEKYDLNFHTVFLSKTIIIHAGFWTTFCFNVLLSQGHDEDSCKNSNGALLNKPSQ